MTSSTLPRVWNWFLIIFGVSIYTVSLLHRLFHNGIIIFSKSAPEDEKIYLISTNGKTLFLNFIYFIIDALALVFVMIALCAAVVVAQRRELFANVINATTATNKDLFGSGTNQVFMLLLNLY